MVGHTATVWVLILIFEQICLASDENFKFYSVEKMLIKQLLEKYEKFGKIGRPLRNTSHILNVEFGLSLFQLMDLDEANQLLTVNVWNKFTWRDELLTWNPKMHNEIKHVRIPVKHVWIPDIVLYNYADERLVELREVLLTVDYTGQIFWSPPAIYKSMCRIQIERFPFDHQICYLRFASWTLDGRRLNLTFLDGRKSALLDDYQESNEWHIEAYPAVRRFFRQTCCATPFPTLIFFFVLKRNPDFYAYLLVLPCILLAVLNLVTFWLPPQVPARMMLGMNIFVGFCIQMKFLTQSTPSASNTIPYLGYYYCLNMVLIAISTFFSLISVNIHFRMDKAKPLPPWLAKAVDKGSRWLRLKRSLSQKSPHLEEVSISKMEMRHARERRKNRGSMGNSTSRSPGLQGGSCFCHQQVHSNEEQAWTTNTLLGNTSSTSATGKQLETSLKEIKRTLRNVLYKANEKDRATQLANEWALVGLTVDRFCFWVYLILIVTTGVGTLIPPLSSVYDTVHNDEDLIQRFKELSTHVGTIDTI